MTDLTHKYDHTKQSNQKPILLHSSNSSALLNPIIELLNIQHPFKFLKSELHKELKGKKNKRLT